MKTDNQGRGYVVQGGIVLPNCDTETYTYTGSNVTKITYKVGGTSGTTVGWMDIVYDGSGNPTSRTVTLV
jgi:hypothetical protein